MDGVSLANYLYSFDHFDQRAQAHSHPLSGGCWLKKESGVEHTLNWLSFYKVPKGVYIHKEEDSGHTLIPHTSTPYCYCC